MSFLTTTLGNTTLWQLVGFAGVGCFGMRWAIQIWFSKKMGISTFPIYFWYFSIIGSLLLITYFCFGNPDLVGILANVCALMISIFNLYLRIRSKCAGSSELSAENSN